MRKSGRVVLGLTFVAAVVISIWWWRHDRHGTNETTVTAKPAEKVQAARPGAAGRNDQGPQVPVQIDDDPRGALRLEGVVLDAKSGGWSSGPSVPTTRVTLTAPKGQARLLLLASADSATFEVSIDGKPVASIRAKAALGVIELGPLRARAVVDVSARPGLLALWIVARTDEIPPPRAKPWVGGGSSDVDPAAERP